MAKVIEFYIPPSFRKSPKWLSPEQRGKIVEFVPQTKKSVSTGLISGFGKGTASSFLVACLDTSLDIPILK